MFQVGGVEIFPHARVNDYSGSYVIEWSCLEKRSRIYTKVTSPQVSSQEQGSCPGNSSDPDLLDAMICVALFGPLGRRELTAEGIRLGIGQDVDSSERLQKRGF